MTEHEPAVDSEDSFWLDEPAPTVREKSSEKAGVRFGGANGSIWRSDNRVCEKIPARRLADRIISQLVGTVTSVVANYVEADDAVSKKEFLKCIGTCKKEARECKHFLRMAACAVPELKSEARQLWLEARGLPSDLLKNLEEWKSEGIEYEVRMFRD